MAETLSWTDRLRVECLVWALDARLGDLPRRSRIAKRREVRENLRTAAMDVGITTALRNIGTSHRLAQEYRVAEYGDAARPHWIAATVFFLTAQLFLTSVLTEAAVAFGDGVEAADPHATGTYVWNGIGYLQSSVTYTFVDGQNTWTGGAWTPFAWALWIIATVLVGRVWRFRWTRRLRTATAGEAHQ
ncbi:hypothetical protein [Streptacidiphilus sp. EB129]|jgi:hypothetical protein|uniref:hypothetical protein n=1 Tax=Streptacidiphilus sp. EB129 TaxID=3156262 RepID=UPI003511C7D3